MYSVKIEIDEFLLDPPIQKLLEYYCEEIVKVWNKEASSSNQWRSRRSNKIPAIPEKLTERKGTLRESMRDKGANSNIEIEISGSKFKITKETIVNYASFLKDKNKNWSPIDQALNVFDNQKLQECFNKAETRWTREFQGKKVRRI